MARKKQINLYPSAAEQWTTCTAAPLFILHLGDKAKQPETVYAQEGTLAHELAEESLTLGYEEEIFECKEMARHVKGYVDFVNSLVGKHDKRKTELKVPLFYWRERNGFVDSCIVHKDKNGHVFKVTIVDLKYGAGVSVQAERNKQMIIYIASVLSHLRIPTKHLDTVEMAIYQPRVRGEEAERRWEISYSDLLDDMVALEKIAKRIRAAKSHKELEFVASEKACRFCDAKPFCKAHAAWLLEDSPVDYADLADDLSDELTIEEMAGIHDNSLGIRKWLESISRQLHFLTGEGEETGYKFVEGRKGNAAWDDEKEAEKFLSKTLKKSERTEVKLLSPTKAKTALKDAGATQQMQAKVDAFTSRSEGKPVLAKLDDPRPNYIDPKNEFDD